MSEKKNIDRLFQEKFKDFEVQPSEKVWRNIESKLKEKKEDRKVIPFWLKLSGVAAALVVGLFTANFLLNSQNKTDNSVVIEENNNIKKEDFNTFKNNETVTSSDVSSPNAKIKHNWDSTDKTVSQQAEKEKNSNPNSVEKAAIQTEVYKSNSGKHTNWNATNNAITRTEALIVGKQKSSNPNALNKTLKNNSAVIESNPTVSNDLKESDKNLLKSEKNEVVVSQNPQKHTLTRPNKKASINNIRNNSINPIAENEKLKGIDTETEFVEKVQITTTQQRLNEDLLVGKGIDNLKTKGIASNNIKADSTSVVAIVPNALEELLKEKENKTVADVKPKLSRWEVSTNVSPVYFNSASNGSPLDSKFENNSKDYKSNLGYGLGVKYALNSKFSLKTGINTVSLEYNTNDIVFYQTKNVTSIDNIKNNLQGSFIQVDNRNDNEPGEITLNGGLLRKFDGKINQKTGYIEVPLELSYKIVDKKFGVEIIGGLSTLFLNENSISLLSSGMDMEVGRADNLNPMHFSTNVGLGFRYSFLKSFQANFEPMFKYQINTYTNDSGNFKPYFIGLYTGISYRF